VNNFHARGVVSVGVDERELFGADLNSQWDLIGAG
jgi:hypothetical protein